MGEVAADANVDVSPILKCRDKKNAFAFLTKGTKRYKIKNCNTIQ